MGHNKQVPLGCTCKDCAAKVEALLQQSQESFRVQQLVDDRFIRAYNAFVYRTRTNPLQLLESDEVLSDCSCRSAGICAQCRLDSWIRSPERAAAKAKVRALARLNAQWFTTRVVTAALDEFLQAYSRFARRTGINLLQLLESDEISSKCSCGGAGTCAQCERIAWLNSPERAEAQAEADEIIRVDTHWCGVREARALVSVFRQLADVIDPDVSCNCPRGCSCMRCLKCRMGSLQLTETDVRLFVQGGQAVKELGRRILGFRREEKP